MREIAKLAYKMRDEYASVAVATGLSREEAFQAKLLGRGVPVVTRQGGNWTYVDTGCKIGDWIATGILSTSSMLTYVPPGHTDKYADARVNAEMSTPRPVRASSVQHLPLGAWADAEEQRIYGSSVRPGIHPLRSIRIAGRRLEDVVRGKRIKSNSPSRKRLLSAIRVSKTWPALTNKRTLRAASRDAMAFNAALAT